MEKKEAKKWYDTVRAVLSFRNVRFSSLWRSDYSFLPNSYSSLDGFTLIELVIVVGIAATLVTIFVLFGNPIHQSDRAKDSKRLTDLRQIKTALDLYYDDHKCYPDSIPSDTWIENGVVYMIKVPKDPDIGTVNNNGYIYQIDKTDTCPQWNVLYTTYTSRAFKDDDCPLSSMSTCNYTGKMACSISGQVDCNYISNNPANGSAPNVPADACPPDQPKIYILDVNNNKCNIAPNNQGDLCLAQCPN